MARKCLIEKEKKRAKMVALKREKRAELKAIIMSPYSTHEARMAAVEKLNKMPKNSAPARQRNRCQLTGRSRGYIRKFQLSRLCFREMASAGLIPGVFKASW